MTPPPPDQPSLVEADDDEGMFEMANLYPRTTGLPMTVWVSPRGNARYDARVKVSRGAGDRMVLEDAAVIGIRPLPSVIEGELGAAELAAVARWIELNREVLLDYWNGAADTAELIGRLWRV